MYLTAYTKEKGKVKALREDVAKIEDEKQKVISKYQIGRASCRERVSSPV